MPPASGPRSDGFPFEAARDLLGVVRALYAAARRDGAPPRELRRIARVGTKLSDAITMAQDTRPGSRAHLAARARAEEASREAGELVDALTPAEPLVGAAGGRVMGARPLPRRRREER